MWRRQQTQTPRWKESQDTYWSDLHSERFHFHCIGYSTQLYQLYKNDCTGASLSNIIYNQRGLPFTIPSLRQIGYSSCRTFLLRVLDVREVCMIPLPFKLWGFRRPGIWLLQPCHSCPSFISFTVARSLHWSYTAIDMSFSGISTNMIIQSYFRRFSSRVGPLAAIECKVSGTEMLQHPPPLPSKRSDGICLAVETPRQGRVEMRCKIDRRFNAWQLQDWIPKSQKPTPLWLKWVRFEHQH